MEESKLNNYYLEDLKDLHRVITKNYHDETALFEEYLAVGKKIFNLESGIVSKIENDNYTVLSFSSPLEGLEEGLVFPLKDTYCQEVYTSKKAVALPHVGADKKMCLHPVYVNMKLESYISAPIHVEGKIFGTLNFTDRKVRSDGFDSHQFDAIEIMAQTIGRFLESQTNKLKIKQLLGIVAHDLKNPMRNIITLSEIVLDEEKMTEDGKKQVQMINDASINCFEMASAILDINAIEDGKIEINKSKVSAKELFNNSWLSIKHLATKKSISLESTTDDHILNVDPARMKQALSNLFTNAIKFSYSDSKVRSTTSRDDINMVICITDQGVGMSQKQIDSAFDATKTTSTLGTDGEKGTGYGLPLVKKIIDHHGGSINIESEPGKGTTFKLTLPI